MTKLNVCCKHCDPCPHCYNVNEYYLRDLLYAIDLKVSQYYDNYLCKKYWGYACNNVYDIEALLTYKYSIHRFYRDLVEGNQTCLCPEDIQRLIEKVLDLVDIGCCTSDKRCDIIIDDSNLDFWTLTNPSCVAYYEWESLLRTVAPTFTVDVQYLPDAGKLLYTLKAYDLVAEKGRLSNEVTPFEDIDGTIRYFKLADCWQVTVTQTDCELTYTIDVSEIEKILFTYNISVETIEKCLKVGIDVRYLEKCKINYDLLVSEQKCNFSFDIYLKLLSCNFSYEILSTLMACGLTVDFNVEEDLPKLMVGDKVIVPSDILSLPSIPTGCELEKLIVELTA